MINPEIKKCQLFFGIEDSQLETLLNCLMAVRRSYKKGGFVFRADSRAVHVGIVLSGEVYVIQEDFWGNRTIFANIRPGDLFGEAFSCAETDKLPISVIASEKSEILLIDTRKIVASCTSACAFHTQLIKNMVHILAEKNIMLTQKLEHLSKRSIREKLLSFLSFQAMKAKSGTIEIPFNRQDLADYLCVDRSALSRELSIIREEGLLRYDKSRFELLRGGKPDE